MKFLFIVQGEGRGHMTQAISLSQQLEVMGHEVSAVCIGKSERREIPEFVKKSLTAKIHHIESPNFITDKKNKGIRIGKTILFNISNSVKFLKSLKTIHHLVITHQPDVIINFYDILGGIYNALYKPNAQFWVIGHQYLIEHPDFKFAEGQVIQKLLFQINTKITALGANKKLALSSIPLKSLEGNNLYILPPLLRKKITLLDPESGDFYLTYMVNPGYGDEVMDFARKNTHIKIEAFWDKKGFPKEYSPLPNLIFHQVDENLFLQKMANCKGFLSTAGFESICEAMYLNKPVMVVPVQGQYEQACNAIETEASGAGIQNKRFDFKLFDDILQTRIFDTSFSKPWTDKFPALFEKIIAEQSRANLPKPSQYPIEYSPLAN
ncbi:glycosyltransferase family protein [Shivajiella indica]|uniref:Glycosyltransferase family protein n=1 Tax=Shivajiella indica TaxID=872115 RepID=A0ABW5BFC2_9BACT